MGPVAAVIGAVVGVASTVASYNAQKKAAKAQDKQQRLAARRSQRQLVREAQIRRANAVNAAGQLGGLGGSALAGGTTSLNSQVGEGLGFSTQMSGLSRQITRYASQAQMFSDLAGLGFGLYNYASNRSADTSNASPTAPPSSGQPNSHAYRIGV